MFLIRYIESIINEAKVLANQYPKDLSDYSVFQIVSIPSNLRTLNKILFGHKKASYTIYLWEYLM